MIYFLNFPSQHKRRGNARNIVSNCKRTEQRMEKCKSRFRWGSHQKKKKVWIIYIMHLLNHVDQLIINY